MTIGSLVLMADPAAAKGPVDVDLVISGGDLRHSVYIPAELFLRAQGGDGGFLGYARLAEPAVPGALSYHVDGYDPGTSRPGFSFIYYPGTFGSPSLMRFGECPDCWGEINPNFDAFLRARLAGRATSLPPVPGPPVAAPTAVVVLMAGIVWLARRPTMRRRLMHLVY